MQNIKGFLVIVFIFVGALGRLYAQNSIDINASSGVQSLRAPINNDSTAVVMFKDVERYRQFDYNKQLANLRSENIGDTLLLNFFGDKQYKAVIQHVTTTNEGSTVITSRIVGSDFAYCYIVVSAESIAISADLPQADEYFFASVKNKQTYIGQMKKSVLHKDRLEDSEPPTAPAPMQEPPTDSIAGKPKSMNTPIQNSPLTPVVIDLLFVYTQSAVNWAKSSIYSNINNVISLAEAEANLVMANSGTGVTFNVVHRYQTDYAGGNSNDLDRFSDPADGYMDEVHDLRSVFCADMMVFLDSISYTGGVGWLLPTLSGFPDDALAANVCRVQQSASGYTVVHEIGHNMVCGHHANQITQPGPNTNLPSPFNLCSSGWRGTIGGTRYCSIMTYGAGSYFADGQTHARIPYFSTPDSTYNGGTIGNASTMDNARVIRETKTATAAYRTPPLTPTLNVSPEVLSFSNAPSATQKVAIAGFSISGNINYVKGGKDTNAFTVTPSATWVPNQGGILNIAFTGSASQN